MKKIALVLILSGLLGLTGCGSSPASSAGAAPLRPRGHRFQALWQGDGVRFILQSPGAWVIYRSYAPFTRQDLDQARWPGVRLPGVGPDRNLAAGTTYYYAAMQGSEWVPAEAPVRVPPARLSPLRHPWLQVDKSHLLLKVLDGKRLVKSYPVVMGRLYRKRKLCYDNASTPEGRYRIVNLQPKATFYRAFDLDYPNQVDQARHRLLRSPQPIGGEIQIHGQGIQSHWTFGCVALRNEDMDELFAHSEIGVGTPVWIYGGEVSLGDLQSDARAHIQDPTVLGLRQKSLGLPITCLMDGATRRRIQSGSLGPQ